MAKPPNKNIDVFFRGVNSLIYFFFQHVEMLHCNSPTMPRTGTPPRYLCRNFSIHQKLRPTRTRVIDYATIDCQRRGDDPHQPQEQTETGGLHQQQRLLDDPLCGSRQHRRVSRLSSQRRRTGCHHRKRAVLLHQQRRVLD